MRRRRSESAARRARRSAIASTSPGSTRKPSTPSRTTSGTPPTRGRDHGPAAGQGLDRAHRRALVGRGEDERVERGVVGRHLVLVAEKEAVPHDPELRARRSTVSRSGPSPTMQRTASTPRSRSRRTASSTSSVRLTPVMRPIQPTTKRSGAMPSCRRISSPGASPSSAPTRSWSSMPRRTTVNFSAGAMPSATRSSRTSGLTAISAVVLWASQRSSRRKRFDAQRAEVAAQDVAVEGVDDDRRRRVARDDGGEPADRARLGRVRVQDLRPQLADQRGDVVDGAEVAKRRDLPVQLGDRHDRDAELLGDAGHRLFAERETPRDERRVVAAFLEPRREIRDVQSRAAHVQPRDDAQDLDRGVSQAVCPRSAAGLPRSRSAAPSPGSRGPRSRRRTSRGCPRRGDRRRSSRRPCRAARRSCRSAR